MTDLIVNSSTTAATRGANKRLKSDGGEPRATKIHYLINGIDICSGISLKVYEYHHTSSYVDCYPQFLLRKQRIR